MGQSQAIALITQAAAQFIRDIGMLGSVVFAMYASYKRLWVWGSELDELRRDRDEWKHIAMKLGGITEAMLNGHKES